MDSEIKDKYILCVGMCTLDIIHVMQEYPDEDSDRRSEHGRWQRGGNASNNCTVFRQLGDKCEFIGTISKEKMFQFVIDDCKNRGIRISNCVYHENCEPPLSSVILNEETGTRTIIHSNPNLPLLTFDDFRKINLNEYKWIHFEGRNRHETTRMIELITLWNKIDNKPNITISVELEKLSPRLICLVEFADVVFLSKDYAIQMGWQTKEEAVKNLRKEVKKSAKIICAWGIDGSIALDNETDEYFTAPAYPPTGKVVDTLGAGDSFLAAVIHCLVRNKSLQEAINFGSRVAGAKVGIHGFDKLGEIFKDEL